MEIQVGGVAMVPAPLAQQKRMDEKIAAPGFSGKKTVVKINDLTYLSNG